MTISFEDIKLICRQYEHNNLYFYKEIPPKKLKNASESFKIPETSEVIALHDSTIFGSCKEGLAICSDGLYWKYDSTSKNSILWEDIDSVNFSTRDNYLTINNLYNIYIYGDDCNKMLAEFILNIKDHIYIDSPPKETILKSAGNVEISANILKEICEKYIAMDTYLTNNIPLTVLNQLRTSFGMTNYKKLIALYNMKLGSFEEAFVICHDGIYFTKPYQKIYKFLWQNIISIDIDYKNKNITLNKWYCIDKLLSDFNIVIDLFLEIKDYLNIDSLIKENNIRNNGNRDFIAKEIVTICEKYICNKLYFKDSIESSKLETIKLNFKISDTINIITIYDVKTGFAICYNGIYLKDSKNTILISWKDILTIDIDFASAAIVLNKHYNIYCSRSDFKVLSDLFIEINNYMNQPYISKNNSKNTSQKVSEKRILDPDKTKQKKNESDRNIPKFIVTKDKKITEDNIAIIKDNQPKNKLTSINNASLDQLLTLPYFTLERAEKILSERKNNVIFTCLDDIIDILNLKPHEAEDLKEYLSFKTSSLKKNSAKREVVKKSEEIINDNINTPIKGRIVDF